MHQEGPERVSELLQRFAEGDSGCLDELTRALLGPLKSIAHGVLRRHRAPTLLQTTALVDQAIAELLTRHSIRPADRQNFLKFLGFVMHRIAMEDARRARTEIRGGKVTVLPLSDEHLMRAVAPRDSSAADRVDLHSALEELRRQRPGLFDVVNLRYFLGMTVPEVARELDCAPATVERRWNAARAHLLLRLAEHEVPPPPSFGRDPTGPHESREGDA